ncbi:MAG: serine hydrolase, partial [Bacteroidetes bacterium]|nr:serine hydrolase [Bacteroidota bacterium]
TAKHFPGHGDTETDSHTKLPLLSVTPERLDSLELYPFRRLIDAGVLAVMSAHVAVPSLTGDSTLPATLSQVLLDSLLRGSMGFRGLIVTDALNMKALTRTSVANIPAAALRAGADVLLLPSDPGATIDSVLAAVGRGEVDSARVLRSVRRVLAFKRWTMKQGTIPDSVITRPERKARNRRFAERLAERSLTLLRNDDAVLPLRCDSLRIGILSIVRRGLPASAEHLRQGFERRGAVVRQLTVARDARSSSVQRWMRDSLAGMDALILASHIAVADGSGTIGLSESQKTIFAEAATRGIPVILIAFGSPYILTAGDAFPVLLAAYGDAPVSVQAAVRLLAGEIPARGRLPVHLPGMFPLGAGRSVSDPHTAADDAGAGYPVLLEQSATARLDSLINAQIIRGAFPGAQLAVIRDDRVVYERSYGRHTYDPSSPLVDAETLYDLASLTKVVGTTAAAMKLYEEGRLHLDSTVTSYLPEFGNNGKEGITIRQLLTHSSGLSPYHLFYLVTDREEAVLDSIYRSVPRYAPGSRTVYSDLGMIVLAKVIERVTGSTLDRYLAEELYAPLGMTHTMFRPPDSLRPRIAPTERDTVWRKRLVHGEVHDETAAILGGVAGHAGLFSTARDLSRYVRMLMNGGSFEGRELLLPSTVALFTTRQSNTGTRALGWDTRSVSGSSSGHYFSMKSYGHTGFTGTSIWIDPVEHVAVVFLTNRVHPTRANKQLPRFRAVLHDAVREALQGIDDEMTPATP